MASCVFSFQVGCDADEVKACSLVGISTSQLVVDPPMRGRPKGKQSRHPRGQTSGELALAKRGKEVRRHMIDLPSLIMTPAPAAELDTEDESQHVDRRIEITWKRLAK